MTFTLYGPADGVPAVFHGGTPSSRFKWPSLAEVMRRSRLRLLVPDRPGYGGSPRRPGRTVADAAADTRALADAQGWRRFAVLGGSGGGPHALACAALLPDQVTRCAILSGVKPVARTLSEPTLRADLARSAAGIMAAIDDGGPEIPWQPGPPARDGPAALARLRATFVDGMDGWVDDTLALARPWGFDPATITAPVALWRGADDPIVAAGHTEWLLAHIPGASARVYAGGHLPGPATYAEIFDWLAG